VPEFVLTHILYPVYSFIVDEVSKRCLHPQLGTERIVLGYSCDQSRWIGGNNSKMFHMQEKKYDQLLMSALQIYLFI